MVEYIIILFAILLSGSIWGWAIPSLSIASLFLTVSYFFYCICKKQQKLGVMQAKINRDRAIMFIFIIGIYAINIAGIAHHYLLSYWNVFLGIWIAYAISETISTKNLKSKYVHIMLVIAGTSLLFWILAQMGIEIGSRIVSPGNGNHYRMNLFYIYRAYIENSIAYGLAQRNSGIFWEGGAYQAFVNIALMFIICDGSIIKNKYKIISYTILTLTVLSTFSTTGYFLLVLNYMLYVLRNTKSNSKRRVLWIIIGAFIVTIIASTSAVANKFDPTADSYISFMIRLNDYLSGFKVAFASPIYGLGYRSLEYTRITESYGIYGNSSGLLILVQQFGWAFAIWYTVMQCKGFVRVINSTTRLEKILCYLFLLLIFGSESLNQYVFFITLTFTMAIKEKKEETNYELKKMHTN